MFLIVVGTAACGPPLRPAGSAWPAADALFLREPRWSGGDGAFSIDLGNGRVLWLFGDSFVDPKGSGRRDQSKMVHNTIGIQTGYDPTTASMQFYWGGTDEAPADFFAPSGSRWRWPLHGARLDDTLLLFFMDVREERDDRLGFRTVGWSAIRIDNPEDTPDLWRRQWLDAPSAGFDVIVGSAVVVRAQHLYAFAVREPGNHDVYLCRWPIGAARRGDLSNPQWRRSERWVEHSALDASPQVMIPKAATEFSIHYDNAQRIWVQVQTHGFGAAQIGIRTSVRLEGPWSEPTMLFRPPESRVEESRILVYAGKAHPEQTGADIVVTYAANEADLAALVQNTSVYWPRFVPLEME